MLLTALRGPAHLVISRLHCLWFQTRRFSKHLYWIHIVMQCAGPFELLSKWVLLRSLLQMMKVCYLKQIFDVVQQTVDFDCHDCSPQQCLCVIWTRYHFLLTISWWFLMHKFSTPLKSEFISRYTYHLIHFGNEFIKFNNRSMNFIFYSSYDT